MENNQQIEKFDPSKLMDGVKDRIKATFVSLEGEKKHVAIAVMATDQDAESNTSVICGTGENLFKGLCQFAMSDITAEKIYMKAAAYVAVSKITGTNQGEIAKA